jgi:hypothetical protein
MTGQSRLCEGWPVRGGQCGRPEQTANDETTSEHHWETSDWVFHVARMDYQGWIIKGGVPQPRSLHLEHRIIRAHLTRLVKVNDTAAAIASPAHP